MKIIIDSQKDNLTVKEILYNYLGLSHAQVTKLKKNEKGIILQGERVNVIKRVREGEFLELALEDTEESVNSDIEAIELPIDILFEDDYIICLNKVSGMPTHPSHGHHDDTLANALSFYYKNKGRPFVFRAVNRLDSETSGVVLIAKDSTSAFKLGKALQRGEFEKEYYAILKGHLEPESGIIETYIRRREDSIIFRTAVQEGKVSEFARTLYRIEEYYGENTLVCATPKTGKTHQLRVHFSYIGHPIVGDPLYGEAASRLMLHAHSLCFLHPVTGKRLCITAPLPTEFTDIMKGDCDGQ